MRDVFLTLILPTILVYGLFSAPFSTLALIWIAFQRPYDFSWGFWKTAPVYQVAFLVALASNILHGQFKPKFPPVLVLYLLLMLWVTISTVFAQFPDRAWRFYTMFVPALVMGPILLYAVVNELKLLKWVLWAAVGGLGANGIKTGISVTASGGAHLTEQISGFVGDNNVFGLVLCLVAAMLMGLRSTLPDRRWIRVAFFSALAFLLLTVVYTKSRGAMLTLGVIFVTASLLGGKPIRHLALVAGVALLAYIVLPDRYFMRLQTLENVSADESAMGRIENWRLAWDAAVAHPVFGVGPDNHIPYHLAEGAYVQVRVAHSVYFQILGELGFVALAIYTLLLLVTLVTLVKTWREATMVALRRPEYGWVRDVAFWSICAVVGYSFGSALLNTFYIEFPWYVMFLSTMLLPLMRRQLAGHGAPGDPAVASTDKRKGHRSSRVGQTSNAPASLSDPGKGSNSSRAKLAPGRRPSAGRTKGTA